MPLYEFQDTRTGKTVDMFLPIERRDDVPSHLKRITVPQRLAVFGTSSDPKEPGVATTTVPKAFREYELSGANVQKIEKETGFSRDHIRRTWQFLWLVFGLLCFPAQAGDFTPGYSFLLNDSVTAAKLNALMGSGSINASFIHGQTLGAPVAADEVVFWLSPSGPFRRASLTTLLLGNTNLIIAQAEDTNPAGTNFFLEYDPAANTLKKTTPNALLTNSIATLAASNAAVSAINALPSTNLTVQTTVSGGDSFRIFDSTNNVNKQVLWSTLLTATYSNATFTLSVTNGTNLYNLPHGFSATPAKMRVVVVCTNASAPYGLGYAVGDEVPADRVQANGTADQWLTYGCNATNYFLASGTNAGTIKDFLMNLRRKDGSIYSLASNTNALSSTSTNWNLKIYLSP